MFLWEVITHPEGYTVEAEEFNRRWNLIQAQGDQQANTIRDILLMLYETLLNDTDGSAHLKVDLPAYATDNLKQVLTIIDERLKADALALGNHKTSGDHDHRYYTEVELNAGQLDNRYFTEEELNNNQLGNLYYTKEDLMPWLRGGDSTIREEVFTIVNSDNGDGTFDYANGEDVIQGVLTPEGYQVFELMKGFYDLEADRVELFVGDTLRRSVVSGGLVEIDPTHIALTSPEGAGAEITIKYFERLGIAAEYNIKLSATKPPFNYGRTMWYKLKG